MPGSRRETRERKLQQRERDRLIYDAVKRFLADEEGLSVGKIAKKLTKDYQVPISREQVYRFLRQATQRKVLRLAAPRDDELRNDLSFFPNRGQIEVLNVPRENAPNSVAEAGAQLVLELILDTYARNNGNRVHLGLGIGWFSFQLAVNLGVLLRNLREAPPLALHALSSAWSPESPYETPISCFRSIEEAVLDVEFHGIWSMPFVPCEDYAQAIQATQVVGAFKNREHVDIVVTSLGVGGKVSCKHGYLHRYLKDFDSPGSEEALTERGWRGDVHLRPFSDEGPMEFERGLKPVTLFEIADLVQLARKPGKHVVLLGAPCGRCGMSKSAALLPLLRIPELHVWTHLLMDCTTAKEVVAAADG